MSDSGGQRIHPKNETLKSASKGRIWLFLALFSAVLAAIPLLATPGLVSTRGGGDSPFLLIRTYEMAQGLRAGQLPVRWMGYAAYGLGYPFFSFYAALPYYVAAALHLWGFGVLWSIRLTQLIGFLAAAAGMYALARRWLSSPPAAALAAIAYTFAPFHLVNVYVRGDSLSEFYAFVWYPLILLSLHRLLERPSAGRVGTLALVYAALVVTHNLSAMIFSPFVLLYALLIIFGHSTQRQETQFAQGGFVPRSPVTDRLRTSLYLPVPGQKARTIGLTLLALALGLLLSAWYWLPALGERDEVQLGEQTTGYFHYSNHFRSRDLVQPTAWFDYDPDAEPTPFAMGLAQAALTLGGTAAFLWHWLRRRRVVAPGLLALLTLVIATLMITPLSRPLWDHLPLLPFVQFPWRFLSVQAFAGSLIIGYLATTLPRPRLVAALAGLVLAVAALTGLRPEALHITEADVTPKRLALYEYFTANIGTTIRAEYLPRHAVPRPYTSAALLTVPSKPPPLLLEGRLGGVMLLEQRPHRERWQLDVTSGTARLVFHTFYFPGWQAQVDGRPVEIESWPGLGYISLALEPGSHEVLLQFGDSSSRQKANLATAAGIVILLALGAVARPWRGLTRRHLWTGGGAIVAALALGLLLRLIGLSVAPPDPSDLTMDFLRQPYLHHNPEGVDFGAVRLLRYTLGTDHAMAGEAVTLHIAWTGSREKELTAQVALVFAVHEGLKDPPVLATSTAAIPPGGGTTQHEIAVPDDAVRGIYFLRVRVIGPEGPLTPTTEQNKSLGNTYLRPLRVTAYRPATGDEPTLGRFGPHIALVDAQVAPTSKDCLAVTLTWRCTGQVATNYDLSLRIYDAKGVHLSEFDDTQPHQGLYPTSLWQTGELVTDRHTVTLSTGKTVDQAQTLEVVLYNRASPALAPVGVVYVPVKERPRSFDVPSMETQVGAEFGGQMRLLGYDLAQSPGLMTLTLHWQAMRTMTTDYKVFVHLFDPATEVIVTQDDAMPRRNTYPTRWWAEGEAVSDAIPLPLADVPAGQYRLAVGVYDPATDDRLEAIDSTGASLPANRLVLEPQTEIP